MVAQISARQVALQPRCEGEWLLICTAQALCEAYDVQWTLRMSFEIESEL